MIKISPSVLAADFAALGSDARRAQAAGADMLHIDVMDGHFVPNISLGLPVVSSLRKACDLFFDVHLMISHPALYAQRFADAGADLITFHLESDDDPAATIKAIRDAGCKVGISVKPATPPEALEPYLDAVDLVLVMTVEPGFGGQKFMADQLPKIAALRDSITRRNLNVTVQVDGGIDDKTAPLVVNAGADCLVSGSYLFGAPDMAAAVQSLKR
ncbi:MAG: ribulose-phosphate 3-epimerase [Clostridia bacterium]|nr:ribulose-phosphate 3-epimerase [Clostridia bacterium]